MKFLQRSWLLLLTTVLVPLNPRPAFAQTIFTGTVSGTSNPYLAGMSAGTMCCQGDDDSADGAPEQSPVRIDGIVPGQAYLFELTGKVANSATAAFAGPDGGSLATAPAANGISGITAPINSLLGVFLGVAPPNLSMSPVALDYSESPARDVNPRTPLLQQVFFIGDGRISSGRQLKIIAPPGATRLYLGTMDAYGWKNNRGSFQVSVSGSPTVRLKALEITQSIQDWNNSIPLVADKPTYVRAFLQGESVLDDGQPVSGLLTARRGGVELPGSPLKPCNDPWNRKNVPHILKPWDITNPPDIINLRGKVDGSMNFVLPEDWEHGTPEDPLILTFEGEDFTVVPEELAEPSGAAADAILRMSFTPVPSLRVTVFRVEFQMPGDPPIPALSAAEIGFPSIMMARRMYPLAGSLSDWNIVHEAVRVRVPEFATSDPVGYMLAAVTEKVIEPHRDRSADFAILALPEAAAEKYLFEINNGKKEIVSGQTLREKTGAWVTVGESVPQQSAQRHPKQAFTLAHEVGHILGQEHTTAPQFAPNPFDSGGPCEERGPPLDKAEEFPYFYYHPLRSSDMAFLGPALVDANNFLIPSSLGQGIYGFDEGPLDPYEHFEIMGYCDQNHQWASKYSYERVLQQVQTRFGSSSVANFSPASASVMWVHASVSLANQTVTWFPVNWYPEGTPSSSIPGPYAIQLRDASGALLHEINLSLNPNTSGRWAWQYETAPVNVAFPANPAARRVELRHNGILLSVLQASANPPTIQLLTPNGGENFGSGPCQISWAAEDADGDSLLYSVEYSKNGGSSWVTLASGLSSPSFIVRADDLTGSASGIFRVEATDGFFTAVDQSDGAFSLSDKAPEIFLLNTVSNLVLYSDRPERFECLVIDAEDGEIPSTNIVWSSDRDGLLGTGSRITLGQQLAAGAHVLTVSASDSAGNTATTHFNVVVQFYYEPDLRIKPGPITNSVTIESIGIPPRRLIIETSLDLVNWVAWRSLPQLTSREIIVDTIQPGVPARFYRARYESLGPVITQQPQGAALRTYQTLSLSVQAVSVEPIAYHWLRDDLPVAGAPNAPAYTVVTNALPSMSGLYSVIASNRLGVAHSQPAVVTVTNQPPQVSITRSQPTTPGPYVDVGQQITFNASATGTPPLSYQWLFNGHKIFHPPDRRFYTSFPCQVEDTGDYSVNVTGPGGSVTSSVRTVTVSDPGLIFHEPFNYPANATLGGLGGWGGSGAATVQAASLGVAGLAPAAGNKFKWPQSSGDASRSTTSFSQGDLYYSFALRVDNLDAGFTNQGRIVSLRWQQASDAVASIHIRTNGSGGYRLGLGSGSTSRVWETADRHVGETVFVVVRASLSRFNDYTSVHGWAAFAPNPATFGLGGSFGGETNYLYDSVGTSLPSGIVDRLLFHSDGPGRIPSDMVMDELRVGRTWASVTPRNRHTPRILQQPSDLAVHTNQAFSLSVVADSSLQMDYHWRSNNQVIVGALNTNTVLLPGLGRAQTNWYSVAVSNAFGRVVSRYAIVAVTNLAVPLTDFENYPNGAQVLFQRPLFASLTSGKLEPTPNIAQVTNTVLSPPAHSGSKIQHLSWAFRTNATNPWLRLQTYFATNLPNPIIAFRQSLSFDAYADRPVYVALSVGDPNPSPSGPIGSDGGYAVGSIEWVGGTTDNTVSPPRGRLVPAGQWTRLLFHFPTEPVRPFSTFANGVLNSTNGLGTLEGLAIVPVSGLGEYNLWLDNFEVIYAP